jgi:hypothetical protein
MTGGGESRLELGISAMPSLQTGTIYLTVAGAPTTGATGVGDWWPDRLRDPRLEHRTADRWFDTSAFALPRTPDGAWYLGNAGRGILATDGLFNLDGGIIKNFRIREGLQMQFRWEVFNLTNTPTLGTPTTNIESPDFGTVRGTVSAPRQMQFSLRVEF